MTSDYQIVPPQRPRLGAPLALLCSLLIVGQPAAAGLGASRLLDSISFRGPGVVLLVALRLLAAAIGVAAGLALLGRRPGAAALARLALVSGAAVEVAISLWSKFPSNLAPGERPFVLAAVLAYYLGWLVYLSRSRRVREIS